MQQIFFYEFKSTFVIYLVFLGLALIGFGLGLMVWLDFRKRFAGWGGLAGWVVLASATLMGFGFGYLATQPEYFRTLSADEAGMTLSYALPDSRVRLDWSQIERVDMHHDRVSIVGRSGAVYDSPVVYRGSQPQLMRDLRALMLERSP